MAFGYYGQKPLPNRLRKFDLAAGDKIKVPGKNEEGATYWTVKKVFPHLFLCEDRRGARQTFQKIEYLLGEITCIKHARDYEEESLW